MIETRYAHIGLDSAGVPKIVGTTMKVVELVTSHQAYGWSPEELHFQYPYLSLGQIHSALAYYWDHKDELDTDIARRYAYAEMLRAEGNPPAVMAKIAAFRDQWRRHAGKFPDDEAYQRMLDEVQRARAAEDDAESHTS